MACSGIAPEAQPYACCVGAPWERKLHGAMRKLLDAEGYGSVLGTRRLIRDMERFDPDIIHLHNPHGCYLNLPMIFSCSPSNATSPSCGRCTTAGPSRATVPISMLADASAGSKNVTIALSSAPILSVLGWMGPAAIIKMKKAIFTHPDRLTSLRPVSGWQTACALHFWDGIR